MLAFAVVEAGRAVHAGVLGCCLHGLLAGNPCTFVIIMFYMLDCPVAVSGRAVQACVLVVGYKAYGGNLVDVVSL